MIERTTLYDYAQGDEPIPGLRLVRFLGQGGFGKVWKAVRPGETEVAVKIIRLDGNEGRREFRALDYVKRIRHANLVPIHAFWLKDVEGRILDEPPTEKRLGDQPTAEVQGPTVGAAALVAPAARELVIEMGLCDKTLADRLDECRAAGQPVIPAAELLHYMEGAAAAIDFLNSPIHAFGPERVGVQHCDIKPKNIMLVGGSVQVCDFGLARIVGPVRSTTISAGTLAYEAPECLEHGKPSASTDQYSLAVSYYELRTGKLPYAAETVGAVTHAILKGKLDFSGVESAERAVLRRATAADPGKRYPSARALVEALRAAVAANPEPRARWPWLALPAGIAAAAAAIWIAYDRGPGPADNRANQIAAAVSPPGPEPTPRASAPASSTAAPLVKSAAAEVPPVSAPAAALEHAKSLLEAGNFPEAETDLLRIIQTGPPSALAYSRLAAAQWYQGKYAEVVEAITQAVNLEPNARDLVTRGRAREKLGDRAAAAADFEQAARLDPRDGDAQYLLGECRRAAGEYEAARAAYERAIALVDSTPDPLYDLAHAHLWRGTCGLNLGRLDEAAEAFAAALAAPGELEPIGELFDELARRFEAAGRPEEAAQWRRKSAEQNAGGR